MEKRSKFTFQDKRKKIQEELLVYGSTDFLDLSWVISVIESVLGLDPQDESTIMEPTMAAIRDLLEGGLAVAGNGVKDDEGYFDVRPWDLPPLEALKRIEDRWKGLQERPTPGDVVWLALTDAGAVAARDLA